MRKFLVNLINVSFGKTLLGFMALQFMFLILAKSKYLQDMKFITNYVFPQGTDYALIVFFIVCTHLLVAANTLVFMKDSYELPEYISKLKQDQKKLAKKLYIRFIGWLILSVFLSGSLSLGFIVCNVFGIRSDILAILLTLNELISIGIFSVFLYADICCLQVCKIILEENTLDDSTRNETKRFEINVKNYIFACDGPGLFGLILITAMSIILHSELSGLFWQGFVAGAIGLHMAFSQSALAFMKASEE